MLRSDVDPSACQSAHHIDFWVDFITIITACLHTQRKKTRESPLRSRGATRAGKAHAHRTLGYVKVRYIPSGMPSGPPHRALGRVRHGFSACVQPVCTPKKKKRRIVTTTARSSACSWTARISRPLVWQGPPHTMWHARWPTSWHSGSVSTWYVTSIASCVATKYTTCASDTTTRLECCVRGYRERIDQTWVRYGACQRRVCVCVASACAAPP